MKIKQYQVDAFASRVFEGNPAAVCPLESWLADDVLQSIAEENNLAETAFFVPSKKGFDLRWFTPVEEVNLCGHATLAAAHIIFNTKSYVGDEIIFSTRSGDLAVKSHGDILEMNFPARPAKMSKITDLLVNGLGLQPDEVLEADDYLVVLQSQAAVEAVIPDCNLLSQLDLRGVIVTARGSDVDFVSRFFAPKFGIPEDPVTGSAHCTLAPYWADKLGKRKLKAKQLSKRGGMVYCEVVSDRVMLSGTAVTFMDAEITI